jgi:hypothetical protein
MWQWIEEQGVESSMQIWDPDMAERSETCPVNDFGNLV